MTTQVHSEKSASTGVGTWPRQSQQNGVATAEVLAELRRREREQGIEPDWSVDALMKAETLEGLRTSITTEFIIRMLGLGICSDTMVRVWSPETNLPENPDRLAHFRFRPQLSRVSHFRFLKACPLQISKGLPTSDFDHISDAMLCSWTLMETFSGIAVPQWRVKEVWMLCSGHPLNLTTWFCGSVLRMGPVRWVWAAAKNAPHILGIRVNLFESVHTYRWWKACENGNYLAKYLQAQLEVKLKKSTLWRYER